MSHNYPVYSTYHLEVNLDRISAQKREGQQVGQARFGECIPDCSSAPSGPSPPWDEMGGKGVSGHSVTLRPTLNT